MEDHVTASETGHVVVRFTDRHSSLQGTVASAGVQPMREWTLADGAEAAWLTPTLGQLSYNRS